MDKAGIKSRIQPPDDLELLEDLVAPWDTYDYINLSKVEERLVPLPGGEKTNRKWNLWEQLKSSRKVSTAITESGVVWEYGDLEERMVPDPYAG